MGTPQFTTVILIKFAVYNDQALEITECMS